jgi:hypothetical protein
MLISKVSELSLNTLASKVKFPGGDPIVSPDPVKTKLP